MCCWDCSAWHDTRVFGISQFVDLTDVQHLDVAYSSMIASDIGENTWFELRVDNVLIHAGSTSTDWIDVALSLPIAFSGFHTISLRLKNTLRSQAMVLGLTVSAIASALPPTPPTPATPTVRKKTADGYTILLSAQKAPTRGGSAARHSRAQVYCDCDHSYASLDAVRKSNLLTWWKKVSDSGIISASNHTILMKICLKYLEEYTQYLHFAWVQRYRVTNTTASAWTNQPVLFSGIETYQTDGQDVLAFLLLQKTTKKGRITYNVNMIDIRLVNDTTVRGQTTVTIPALPPGASCLVDLYSYYRPNS